VQNLINVGAQFGNKILRPPTRRKNGLKIWLMDAHQLFLGLKEHL